MSKRTEYYPDTEHWKDGWDYEPGEVATHPVITRTERSCRVCDGTGYMGWAVKAGRDTEEIECEVCDGKGQEWIDPLLVVAENRKKHHAGPVKSRSYYRAFGASSSMGRLRMVEAAIRMDVACRSAVSAWRAAA